MRSRGLLGESGFLVPACRLSVSFARAREWQALFQSWEKEVVMFLILFIVLLVAWLLGFVAFHVAGALIHLLLIIAVIALIVHFVRGRRVA